MADASTSMRGIAFMAMGMFLFAAADTIAKFLTSDFHPIQIMWTRQSGLILGVLILIGFKGFSILFELSYIVHISERKLPGGLKKYQVD